MSQQEIESVIGPEDAAKVYAAFGGFSLLVSNRGDTFNRLSAVIGTNKAIAFCDHFSGTHVYIQKQAKLTLEERNRAIIHEYDKGKSVPDLSMQYDISDRHIYSILKKPL
jgi:hypothetical protein